MTGSLVLFGGGLSFDEFAANNDKQDAAVFNILQVGELAYEQLSSECKQAMPTIPWKQIIDMRHKMVHHYESYNARFVYRTALEDIPVLKAEIQKALSVGKMDLFGESK